VQLLPRGLLWEGEHTVLSLCSVPWLFSCDGSGPGPSSSLRSGELLVTAGRNVWLICVSAAVVTTSDAWATVTKLQWADKVQDAQTIVTSSLKLANPLYFPEGELVPSSPCLCMCV
jgi:hypothetical protein